MRIDFTKCPACGSEGTGFFAGLAQRVKDKGYGRPEWDFYLDIKQGIVMDKTQEAKILIGSTMPTFKFGTDICSHCGCVFARFIEDGEAEKQLKEGVQN